MKNKGAGEMKNIYKVITAAAILLTWVNSSFAGEILGYPIVPKQAQFYMIILSVIGVSIALVSTAYFCFWLADLRKKNLTEPTTAENFGSPLAAVAQPAK